MSTASAAMEARILWFLTHFERSVCFAASNRAFLSVPAGKNTMSCEHTSLNRFDSCASSSDEVFSILWFNRVEQGGNKLDFRSILGAEYASRNCSKVCAVVTRDGRFWTVDEITGVVNAEYDIIGEARERRLRRLFEVEVHNGTHVAFRSLANGRYIVVAGGAVSPVGSVGAGTPGGGTTGSGGASTLLDEILGSTAPTPPVPIGSVSCSSTTASVQCLFQPFVKASIHACSNRQPVSFSGTQRVLQVEAGTPLRGNAVFFVSLSSRTSGIATYDNQYWSVSLPSKLVTASAATHSTSEGFYLEHRLPSVVSSAPLTDGVGNVLSASSIMRRNLFCLKTMEGLFVRLNDEQQLCADAALEDANTIFEINPLPADGIYTSRSPQHPAELLLQREREQEAQAQAQREREQREQEQREREQREQRERELLLQQQQQQQQRELEQREQRERELQQQQLLQQQLQQQQAQQQQQQAPAIVPSPQRPESPPRYAQHMQLQQQQQQQQQLLQQQQQQQAQQLLHFQQASAPPLLMPQQAPPQQQQHGFLLANAPVNPDPFGGLGMGSGGKILPMAAGPSAVAYVPQSSPENDARILAMIETLGTLGRELSSTLWHTRATVAQVQALRAALTTTDNPKLFLAQRYHTADGLTVVAELLRQSVLELPEPLIPVRFREGISACIEFSDEALRIQGLANLIAEIPSKQRYILRSLVSMLHHLAYKGASGTAPYILVSHYSSIFAPVITRVPEQEYLMRSKCARAVELLISDYEAIFIPQSPARASSGGSAPPVGIVQYAPSPQGSHQMMVPPQIPVQRAPLGTYQPQPQQVMAPPVYAGAVYNGYGRSAPAYPPMQMPTPASLIPATPPATRVGTTGGGISAPSLTAAPTPAAYYARGGSLQPQMVPASAISGSSSSSSSSAVKEKLLWELDSTEIVLERRIGSGASGEVWLGTWAGTKVAVKKLSKVQLTESDLKSFEAEIDLMSKMRHPNIVPFLGACVHPEFMLVTEYMERGSLTELLGNPAIAMSGALKIKLSQDIAKGMLYLHTRHPPIVHRDVKSLNILVTKDWKAVVADFGLTKIMNRAFLNSYCGSPAWVAPEVLRGEQYDESADVYSYGIVLWEMLTRTLPYKGLDARAVIGKVAFQTPAMRPEIPSGLRHPYVTLMQECWQELPRTRPTFALILERLNQMPPLPDLM